MGLVLFVRGEYGLLACEVEVWWVVKGEKGGYIW